MTYTPRQIADAINNARAQTGWHDYALVVDTAAIILAGAQASDAMLDDAKAQIEREMK
ncbi:hypothetical protein [Paracoccus homiensis]|uniref:Uncharacterized protein n=1 Tax=Paracoccus homiensis TaxID=364199 RepID=A0A1I0IYK7_9RHOB|nr:hypothetical protein [Paracoccus homiensis]SEU02466.1 hypothetical protein SAMN04489858_12017 [Paracoccus homiensis]